MKDFYTFIFILVLLSANIIFAQSNKIDESCPQGMISYWKLNESDTATTFVDSFGGHNGFTVDTLKPAQDDSGIVGFAKKFNGKSGIEVPEDTAFDWSDHTSFSVETWIKTTSPGTGTKVFIGKRRGGNTQMTWWLGYKDSNYAAFFVRDSGGTFTEADGNTIINDGKWHHIVGIRNDNLKTLQLFVDGVQEANVATAFTGNFSGTDPIYIGFYSDDFFFTGSLDEMALYNLALNKTQVDQHYSNGLMGIGYCQSGVSDTISAPSNLKAIRPSPDSTFVELTWKDNSSNELGFIIQRKTGDSTSISTFNIIDTVASNVTTYTDSTTQDTMTYTYRVEAYDSNTVSAFSNSATITTPLPVELTSFTASVVKAGVLLSWETATEMNNAGFNIEKSINNKDFAKIAFIKGRGTTTSKSFYSYTDKSAGNGKCYYRLKQIDFNGTSQYSKSIQTDLKLPQEFSLDQNYPNPFNPSTTIGFALPQASKVFISVYNILGQKVATLLNQAMDAGFHQIQFNGSNLSSGTYIYKIQAGNFNQVKKMVLLK